MKWAFGKWERKDERGRKQSCSVGLRGLGGRLAVLLGGQLRRTLLRPLLLNRDFRSAGHVNKEGR